MVLAEFVEDEDTTRLLREYGVDMAQGYHLGRPVDAGDRRGEARLAEDEKRLTDADVIARFERGALDAFIIDERAVGAAEVVDLIAPIDEKKLRMAARNFGVVQADAIGRIAADADDGVAQIELPAFVLTPISPHTLTYRPVVDSADKVYTITMGRGSEQAVLIVDGQETFALSPQHRVTVRRAPVAFTLVKVPGHSFYQTLRDKDGDGVADFVQFRLSISLFRANVT